MESRTVEATAPTCIDLAGGAVLLPGGYVTNAERAAVSVAIDRRALCRVETGLSGLQVESKDEPFRFEGRDVSALLSAGCPPLVPSVLHALGMDSGLRVTIQSRSLAGSGLGDAALAIAVAAATSTAARGGDPGPDAIVQLARDALAGLPGALSGPHRLRTAVLGGVTAFLVEPGTRLVERLETDPGRVEESLLLVDTGTPAVPATPVEAARAHPGSEAGLLGGVEAAEIETLARAIASALAAHRYEDVGRLIGREWEARIRLNPEICTPPVERIAAIARAAGGAARTCAGGGAGWMLVWASPGRTGEGSHERAQKGLREAGYRPLAFRVDLRGLEVDC